MSKLLIALALMAQTLGSGEQYRYIGQVKYQTPTEMSLMAVYVPQRPIGLLVQLRSGSRAIGQNELATCELSSEKGPAPNQYQAILTCRDGRVLIVKGFVTDPEEAVKVGVR